MTEKQEQEDKESQKRQRAYYDLFTSKLGQTILEDMRVGFCGTSHVAGDPYTTAFNEGQRVVVLKIEAIIKTVEHEIRSQKTQQTTYLDNPKGENEDG